MYSVVTVRKVLFRCLGLVFCSVPLQTWHSEQLCVLFFQKHLPFPELILKSSLASDSSCRGSLESEVSLSKNKPLVISATLETGGCLNIESMHCYEPFKLLFFGYCFYEITTDKEVQIGLK